MSRVYLDWAATARPDPQALQETCRIALEYYANPSSIHNAGVRAHALLEDCRQRLAAVLSCAAEEVIFTSGGTEANNMALFSLLHRKRDRRAVLSGIEHDSLYQPARRLQELGCEVKLVPAGKDGRVHPERICSAVNERTALVALMLINNESGAIQPVEEVAEALAELRRRTGRRVLLHTDAVQGFGKLALSLSAMNVDTAAISAHKIGGPRGVGALYVRKVSSPEFLYSGGGQEFGRRPGTENLPGIYGLAACAEKAVASLEPNLSKARALMERLIENLRSLEGCLILPSSRNAVSSKLFSPYILSVAFPPVPGEILVRVMEEEGFLISTGSACSSRKKERSRVLENMGVPREIASCGVRVSLGPDTRGQELENFVAALKRRLPELRQVSAR